MLHCCFLFDLIYLILIYLIVIQAQFYHRKPPRQLNMDTTYHPCQRKAQSHQDNRSGPRKVTEAMEQQLTLTRQAGKI